MLLLMTQKTITVSKAQSSPPRKPSWLPTLLAVIGIVGAVYSLFMAVAYWVQWLPYAGPYWSAGLSLKPETGFAGLAQWYVRQELLPKLSPYAALFVVTSAVIAYALWLYKRQHENGVLPENHKLIIYGLLFALLVLVPSLFFVLNIPFVIPDLCCLSGLNLP
jgi:hypothetical protein